MVDNAFHQLKSAIMAESTRIYKARGILVKRCEICQLKLDYCICGQAPKTQTPVDFVLIFHRDELFKPTNSGRLIADVFPGNTQAFCWSRTQPDPSLLVLLQDQSRHCVIIFPAEGEGKQRVIDRIEPQGDKKLTLVLLDATWRQGRRMFNFSKWLGGYEVLKLNPSDKSRYTSRKAASDQYLSTAESAALALASAGEEGNAQLLMDYFDLFNRHYAMTKSNV